MSIVRTFLGDIDANEMGFTYSHEHIVCIPPRILILSDTF